jgi:hypothetical protein
MLIQQFEARNERHIGQPVARLIERLIERYSEIL